MKRPFIATLLATLIACSSAGPAAPGGAGGGGTSTTSAGTSSTTTTTLSGVGGDLGLDAGTSDAGSGGAGCVGDDPPPVDGGAVPPVLAAEFAASYRVFDLGPVPGVPGRLGGCVIAQGSADTLLIAGDSESPSGAIYGVAVKRNQCGHIVGFAGQAIQVATAPYVDANLVYGANGVLLFTQWNINKISQIPAGAAAPAVTTDMTALGVPVSVSGLGFVPPGLPAAGQLRAVTWSGGDWFHLDLAANGQLYTLSNPVKTVTLAGGPGGFAYVPEGSPGFPKQSLIEAEWSVNTVGVYEADAQGDPVVATRRDFFTSFDRPWGAYFEPQTGDYLFLTWGAAAGPDRVFVVQGFTQPPPPPPPPQ